MNDPPLELSRSNFLHIEPRLAVIEDLRIVRFEIGQRAHVFGAVVPALKHDRSMRRIVGRHVRAPESQMILAAEQRGQLAIELKSLMPVIRAPHVRFQPANFVAIELAEIVAAFVCQVEAHPSRHSHDENRQSDQDLLPEFHWTAAFTCFDFRETMSGAFPVAPRSRSATGIARTSGIIAPSRSRCSRMERSIRPQTSGSRSPLSRMVSSPSSSTTCQPVAGTVSSKR